MPIPQRTIRVIALDPIMSFNGQRIHTLWGGRAPEGEADYFISLLNYGTNEPTPTYVREPTVLYANEVPLRSFIYYSIDCQQPGTCPHTETPTCSSSLSGDAYRTAYNADPDHGSGMPCRVQTGGCTTPPPEYQAQPDLRRAVFDLFPDTVTGINNGTIHEVWLWVPRLVGGGSFEMYMLANPNDTGRYPVNGGLLEDSRINVGRKVMLHFLGDRPDTYTEVYNHRIESIMRVIFGTGGAGCGANFSLPGHDRVISTVTTPYALSEVTDFPSNYAPDPKNDLGNQGDAMIGWGHQGPYVFRQYSYDMDDVVPSSGHLFPNYPTGFPLDLTRNDRRRYVNQEYADYAASQRIQYPGTEGIGSKNGFQAGWQWPQFPKNAATDSTGRLNNWWLYFTDVNQQTGRGNTPSNMVTGPFNGARDLRLQVNYVQSGSNWVIGQVILRWKRHVNSTGTYTINYWDGVSWYPAPGIPTLPGSTTSQVVDPPAAGAARLYLVAYADPTTKFSDVLGLGRLANDADRLSRPPTYVATQLYQMNPAQMRFGFNASTHPNGTRCYMIEATGGGSVDRYLVTRKVDQTDGAMVHGNTATTRYYYALVTDSDKNFIGASDLFYYVPGSSTV